MSTQYKALKSDSAIGIEKFQGFLDFGIILESMESTMEFLNLGCLGQLGIGFQGLILSGQTVPVYKNGLKIIYLQ